MPRKDTYILDRPTGRSMRARDALICVFVAVLVLLVSQGQSIRESGEEMEPGIERTVVLAVGHPAGWVADRFGLDDDVERLTASLSPDEALERGRRLRRRRRGRRRAARTARRAASRPTRSTRPRSARSPPCCRSSRRCSSPATRCRSRWTCSSRGASPRTASRRSASRTWAPGISKSALLDWGRAVDPAGAQGGARGGRVLPRRQRGLPVRGRRAASGRLLRPRVGRAVRDARAADDGHLPPQRRRPRLLADAADAARPRRARRSPARSTPRSSPPHSRTARTSACST